jgi:hypothetical protein
MPRRDRRLPRTAGGIDPAQCVRSQTPAPIGAYKGLSTRKEPSMSTNPTGRGVRVQSILSLLEALARRVLWTSVGALVARPLQPMAQPLPTRTTRVSRRTTSGLGDGT